MKWLCAFALLLTLQFFSISCEFSDEYLDDILEKSLRHVEDDLKAKRSLPDVPVRKSYRKRNHPEIAEISKRSSIFVHAVDTLMAEKSCSRDEAERALDKRASARPEFNANVLCSSRTFNCQNLNTPYRNANGTCNNPFIQNAFWGVATIPMVRLMGAAYDDGSNAPRMTSVTGQSLPNPRVISVNLHPNLNVNHPFITNMVPGFGQFLDHDLTSTPERNDLRCCSNPNDNDCFEIPIRTDDPFYSQFGIGCLEFGRSVAACGSSPREQINQVTAFIDGSQIYGSSDAEQRALRALSGGLLLSENNGARLPRDNAAQNCGNPTAGFTCFKAGDARVNENPELFTMHHLFLREHNRIATQLAILNPSWNDETVFQETRRIIIAELQQVTYNEFLPAILGSNTMANFRILLPTSGFTSYDNTINPGIINSFATAAYRLHTLVQGTVTLGSGTVALRNNFQNPTLGYTAGNVEGLMRGMCSQPSQNYDNWVSDDLTNHLFQRPNVQFGADLVSLNIQRGRDHGLPAYPRWRNLCGLSQINQFGDLNGVLQSNANLVSTFQSLYSNVNDIDLWPAGTCEIPVTGGVVGPTFACIIGAQMNRLLYGDRYFFTHGGQAGSFTANQLTSLRSRRLANIICDNGFATSVQPNVFLQTSSSNAVQVCPQSNLNLNLWKV